MEKEIWEKLKYLPVLIVAMRLRAILEQFQNLTLPSSWPVTRTSRPSFKAGDGIL
jgi:hypothetical protein